jgi:hypothetical protein
MICVLVMQTGNFHTVSVLWDEKAHFRLYMCRSNHDCKGKDAEEATVKGEEDPNKDTDDMALRRLNDIRSRKHCLFFLYL